MGTRPKSPLPIAMEETYEYQTAKLLANHMVLKGLDTITAAYYANLIVEKSAMYENVDPITIMAMADVESGGYLYDPTVRGGNGEYGMLQIMPFHAKAWGIPEKSLAEPEVNIERACFYLNYLIDRFGYRNGVIAYNQGEGNVRRGTYKTWYWNKVEAALDKINLGE